MKNTTLLLIIILLAGFSCKPKQPVKDNYIFFAGMPTRAEEELARLVFEKGDEIAYRELRGGYYLGSYYKFLEYALYMANKYDFKEAYFDVYYCLANIHDDLGDNGVYNLDRLDETTRQMALNYLQKAQERGTAQASRYLGEYYMEGKYFKKDTILGKKLMMEYKERL